MVQGMLVRRGYLFRRAAERFATEEDGSGFAWNIFWCVVFLSLAGLTIDTSLAYRMKRALVATADSAALAASMGHDKPEVYETVTGKNAANRTPEERGRELAAFVSERIMSPESNGEVVAPEDVRFGSFSREMGFVEGHGFHAQATAARAMRNGNALRSLLLGRLTDIKSWDVGATAVARPNNTPCHRNGVITADIIDMQSNNRFANGICLHGEGGVEVNQNNVFEPGVIVSMPSPDLLVVPGGHMGNNEGLAEALAWGNLEPELAMQANGIIASLDRLGSEWQPDYIRDNPSARVIRANEGQFEPEDMEPGNVYVVTCNGGNNTLNLRGRATDEEADAGDDITGIRFARNHKNGGNNAGGNNGGGNTGGASVIRNVVIVTNCDITFSRDTVIEDALVATTSTDAKSVQGSAGVQIGRVDDCEPGGGAVVITAGGIHFAAKMELHGSQLVARGEVKLAAQVNGLGGTAIQALGRVDMASNNAMALCAGAADEQLPLEEGSRRVF